MTHDIDGELFSAIHVWTPCSKPA